MRIVIHQAYGLRMTDVINGMRCYITAVCGYNPPKSTSIQRVPRWSDSYPAEWNEPLDMVVQRMDESALLQIMEKNSLTDDDVAGTLDVSNRAIRIPDRAILNR